MARTEGNTAERGDGNGAAIGFLLNPTSPAVSPDPSPMINDNSLFDSTNLEDRDVK
jgi:hypothetical protein